MPTPEELETNAFDREVAEWIGPTDPDALFRFGQAHPEAATVTDALTALMPQPAPEQLAAFRAEFDDTPARPYQGSVVDPADLEALRAEQVPATPTGPKPGPAYAGDPANLGLSNWHALSDLEAGRLFLRTSRGEEMTIRIRRVPVAAFLTEVLYPIPPWTERHIFAEQSDQDVSYVIGYTQTAGYLVNRIPPGWVTQAAETLPSVYRDTNRIKARGEP